jgi:transcriptional regulator NrdR family protein
MTARTPKLTVVKADGTREEYFHTKVVGTIANALGSAGRPDIHAAQEIADAVTFFLYRTAQPGDSRISIGAHEILSIIKTVLADTGFEEAAITVSEHHFERKLKRCRVEVAPGRSEGLSDAEELYTDYSDETRSKWDKSRIVEYLVAKHRLHRQTARTIASMVEEKVFNLGLPVIPAGLVKQLVLNDAAAVLRAQNQMQTTCGE